jgi:hypothetical protein
MVESLAASIESFQTQLQTFSTKSKALASHIQNKNDANISPKAHTILTTRTSAIEKQEAHVESLKSLRTAFAHVTSLLDRTKACSADDAVELNGVVTSALSFAPVLHQALLLQNRELFVSTQHVLDEIGKRVLQLWKDCLSDNHSELDRVWASVTLAVQSHSQGENQEDAVSAVKMSDSISTKIMTIEQPKLFRYFTTLLHQYKLLVDTVGIHGITNSPKQIPDSEASISCRVMCTATDVFFAVSQSRMAALVEPVVQAYLALVPRAPVDFADVGPACCNDLSHTIARLHQLMLSFWMAALVIIRPKPSASGSWVGQLADCASKCHTTQLISNRVWECFEPRLSKIWTHFFRQIATGE